MNCPAPQTFLFYGVIFMGELGITFFLGHVFYKATQNTTEAEQWRWSSEDSRDMWVEASKTMITSSGIAAALIASLALAANRTNSLDVLVASSVKTATANLVLCVCSSMFLILALSRGHEAAKARNIIKRRQQGLTGEVKEGPLSNLALGITLAGSFIALSSFFIGFLFLARIVWHI